MKLLLQIQFDSSVPHEKLVYDLITGQPPKAQKDFILSSILHYSKAPSYLAEVKMTEYLEQIKKLNAIFEEATYQSLVAQVESVAAMQDNLILSISDAIATRVQTALGDMDFSQVKRKSKKDEKVAAPENVVSDMLGNFGT